MAVHFAAVFQGLAKFFFRYLEFYKNLIFLSSKNIVIRTNYGCVPGCDDHDNNCHIVCVI